MDDNGLTQTEVARRLGVSQSSIQRVLAGKAVRTGPARRKMADGLLRIKSDKDEYSPSDMSRDLSEKLTQMCEDEDDETILRALLDAVIAYRRRAVD